MRNYDSSYGWVLRWVCPKNEVSFVLFCFFPCFVIYFYCSAVSSPNAEKVKVMQSVYV